MNNSFILAAMAAAMCLVSCSKAEVSPSNGRSVELKVCLEDKLTKASAQTGDEAAVKNFQVFVFNGDNLDSYGSATSSEVSSRQKTLPATTGKRTVMVLVNAPDLSSVTSMSQLSATVTRLLDDNAADSFLMVGNKSVTLTASSSVSIEVERIAARVMIRKISRKFTNSTLASLAAGSFQIKRLYLSDVVDNALIGMTAPGAYLWKNSILSASGAITKDNSLIYKDINVTVAQNSSYSTPNSLYCYPNPTSADSPTARMTRLIVECAVDGQDCTYVIPLGAVANNRSYEINELVITRLGNPSDGDDTIEDGESDVQERSEVTFSLTVKDWNVVLLGSEGTVSI